VGEEGVGILLGNVAIGADWWFADSVIGLPRERGVVVFSRRGDDDCFIESVKEKCGSRALPLVPPRATLTTLREPKDHLLPSILVLVPSNVVAYARIKRNELLEKNPLYR